MSIEAVEIDKAQADRVTQIEEGQFSEVKAIAIAPSKLTATISAFANSDGGDLYVGINEVHLGGGAKTREWAGFADVEAANGHLQSFERLFPLGTGPDPSIYDKALKAVPTPELAYAPVPVHSVALTNDKVMRPWTKLAGCKKYRRYVKAFSKTKLYRAQAKRFSPFLQRMATITGINEGKKSPKILYFINEIYEPLTSNIAHNLPIPKEISKKDMELLRLLSDWNYHYQFLGKKVGRLTGGPFVGEIAGNFSRYIKQPGKARKFNVYSGHQRTVLGVEAALGIETAHTKGPFFKGRVPALGSHYAFELHEGSKGAYAVRLKFVSDEGEKTITIPGCGGPNCPFERFKKVVDAVSPKDWRAECTVKSTRRSFFSN